MIDPEVRRRVAAALGADEREVRFEPAGGGLFSNWRVEAGGRRFFLKTHTDRIPHMFEAEALGLERLSAAARSLGCPTPIAHSDEPGSSFLLMDFVETGHPGRDFEQRLAAGLAEVHARARERRFGFPVDGTCGRTPQANGWCDSWVEFFASRRLEPQIALARERGLGRDDLRVLERLAARLADLLPDRPPASLVHGDLWSGNVLCDTAGRPVLVDPAPSYAHAEYEFGMTVLFGGFSQLFYRAYDATAGLEPGWRERAEIYSVYHLLNHFHLFGGGYGKSAVETARRFVGGGR